MATYLVVALAEELELLRLLVHEDTVEVARLRRADLDRLVAPAHHLTRADVRCTREQISNDPLLT